MRRCAGPCGRALPLTQFWRAPGCAGGRRLTCADCEGQKQKERRRASRSHGLCRWTEVGPSGTAVQCDRAAARANGGQSYCRAHAAAAAGRPASPDAALVAQYRDATDDEMLDALAVMASALRLIATGMERRGACTVQRFLGATGLQDTAAAALLAVGIRV